jgi:hypothetical protein
MDVRDALISGLVTFSQNTVGIVFRPYETYRRITRRENVWELPFIALILAVYFAVASAVKTAAFHPFILSKQFVLIGSATGLTYIVMICLMFKSAQVLGGVGTLKRVALGWAYTLIPTLVWFMSTSVLYVILPPPRTTSAAGMAFSAAYLVFSAALFFWKTILMYLTLRFGMRLDLPKIAVIFVVVVPLMVLYSIGMYKLGIFRIPFI